MAACSYRHLPLTFPGVSSEGSSGDGKRLTRSDVSNTLPSMMRYDWPAHANGAIQQERSESAIAPILTCAAMDAQLSMRLTVELEGRNHLRHLRRGRDRLGGEVQLQLREASNVELKQSGEHEMKDTQGRA